MTTHSLTDWLRWLDARLPRRRGAVRFTPAEFLEVFEKFNGRCAYCGDPVPWSQVVREHVIPLSRGGHGSIGNILPSCVRCNGSKGAKLLREWAAWRAERGQPLRSTAWKARDPRYRHLTGQWWTRSLWSRPNIWVLIAAVLALLAILAIRAWVIVARRRAARHEEALAP